jgi:hypothetical protein
MEKLSLEQLHDLYFMEYGYEPSANKSKEDLVAELEQAKCDILGM